MNPFAVAMATERQAAGLSMGQVARAMDVTVSYISQLEAGKATPMTRERILEMARVLEREPEVLLEAAAACRGRFDVPYFENPTGRQLATALQRLPANATDYEAVKAVLSVLGMVP